MKRPHANFAITTRGSTPGVAHLGIQVDYADELGEIYARLRRSGGWTLDERGTTCCYAQSMTQWIEDPQRVAWETFLTHGESATFGRAQPEPAGASGSCCGF